MKTPDNINSGALMAFPLNIDDMQIVDIKVVKKIIFLCEIFVFG